MRQLILLGLMFAATAWATDVITRDGTTYRDCTVSKVDPNGISILYTNGPVGGAKIKFVDLPEDVQKHYNYDPAKAAEFEKEEEAQKLREAEALKLALQNYKSHSQTNSLSNTNGTNQVAKANQKTPQHHPQYVSRPRVYRPPVVHVPAPRPPVQHHPSGPGKKQSVAALRQENEPVLG